MVLGADEEADGGTRPSSRTQIGEATRTVPLPPCSGIDPHLLELHRRGRPGRRLGLEEDDPVLGPEPRAPFLDLGAGAPPEAFGITTKRVDPDLQLAQPRTPARGARGRRMSLRATRSRCRPGSRRTNTGCPGRSSRGRGRRARARSQSSETAADSPISIRGEARTTSRANAPQPCPEGTALTPTWQSACSSRPSASPTNRPRLRLATSSRKTRSTGSSAQKRRIWSCDGLTTRAGTAGTLGRLSIRPSAENP